MAYLLHQISIMHLQVNIAMTCEYILCTHLFSFISLLAWPWHCTMPDYEEVPPEEYYEEEYYIEELAN